VGFDSISIQSLRESGLRRGFNTQYTSLRIRGRSKAHKVVSTTHNVRFHWLLVAFHTSPLSIPRPLLSMPRPSPIAFRKFVHTVLLVLFICNTHSFLVKCFGVNDGNSNDHRAARRLIQLRVSYSCNHDFIIPTTLNLSTLLRTFDLIMTWVITRVITRL